MNVKIVAVLLVCAVIATEARPGRGNEGGSGHHDSEDKKIPPPAGFPAKAAGKGRDSNYSKSDLINMTVEGLKKLCEGLSSGNITNTNSSYDAVFTSLGDVCADVDAYLAAQAVPPPAPAQDPAAGGARRKRGARPGGARGPGAAHGGNHSEESAENDDEEKTAVAILFRICKGLERVQANLPADLASDLANIITKTGAVCAAANLVRNPVVPA